MGILPILYYGWLTLAVLGLIGLGYSAFFIIRGLVRWVRSMRVE